MLGVFAVTDFRNTETWIEARFIVCALLELSEVWSRQMKYRRLAKDVGRFSVGLLNEIALGYDSKGRRPSPAKAMQSIDKLERALQKMHQHGALGNRESLRLKESLETVKHSLRKTEY